MANLVLTDAVVVINAVDLSSHVRSVTLTFEAEMVDDTMMGDGTRSNKPGLKNWQMEVEFEADYAAAQIDATLFPLVGAAAFTVSVKPVSGAISATNPSYNGLAVLASFQPVGGSVGALAMVPATFRCAGALSRSVA